MIVGYNVICVCVAHAYVRQVGDVRMMTHTHTHKLADRGSGKGRRRGDRPAVNRAGPGAMHTHSMRAHIIHENRYTRAYAHTHTQDGHLGDIAVQSLVTHTRLHTLTPKQKLALKHAHTQAHTRVPRCTRASRASSQSVPWRVQPGVTSL